MTDRHHIEDYSFFLNLNEKYLRPDTLDRDLDADADYNLQSYGPSGLRTGPSGHKDLQDSGFGADADHNLRSYGPSGLRTAPQAFVRAPQAHWTWTRT